MGVQNNGIIHSYQWKHCPLLHFQFSSSLSWLSWISLCLRIIRHLMFCCCFFPHFKTLPRSNNTSVTYHGQTIPRIKIYISDMLHTLKVLLKLAGGRVSWQSTTIQVTWYCLAFNECKKKPNYSKRVAWILLSICGRLWEHVDKMANMKYHAPLSLCRQSSSKYVVSAALRTGWLWCSVSPSVV